jgi:type IV pilus assembly protein PilF
MLSSVLFACVSVQEQQRAEKTKFQIADTNVRLGLGYLKQGRTEAALEKLKKAIAAMPEYAEAHSSIALVYEALREPDKASEHYQQAVSLKPEDGKILNNYAVFLCGQGKPKEAEPYFLKAIKTRSYRTPAQAYENLGVCVMQIPDLEKAETYLRKALQINPRLPGALLQMAVLSFDKKRMLSARAYLERYQAVAPMGPDALWLGIQVERKMGDRAAAGRYETQLRSKYPDSNEMRMLLEEEEKAREGVSRK